MDCLPPLLCGTSCTVPFLGAALRRRFRRSTPTVVYWAMIFTAIAAGMSLPYFLLTA